MIFCRWKLGNSSDDKFCPKCNAKKSERHLFDAHLSQMVDDLDNLFPCIKNENIIICLLHAKLRITEKLIRLAIQTTIESSYFDVNVLIDKIKEIVPCFEVYIPKGNMRYYIFII